MSLNLSDDLRRSELPVDYCLAYLAECQLATVEGLKLRKRVSQSDLERHEAIARFAIDAVRLHVPQGLPLHWTGLPRLREHVK